MDILLTTDKQRMKKTSWEGLLSNQEGNAVKTPSEKARDIIYEPNDLRKALFGEVNVLDSEPFSNIRTGSEQWELYLLRMFVGEYKNLKNIYEKYLTRSPNEPEFTKYNTYDNCTRTAIGQSKYSEFLERYPEINDKELKKESSDYIKQVIAEKVPLRIYKNNQTKKYRAKAALAFYNYLSKTKIKRNDHIESFQERLTEMLDAENKRRKAENEIHILTISLMYCLYGTRKAERVNVSLRKKLIEGLTSKSNGNEEILNRIIKRLEQARKYSAKQFMPPCADIFALYRDRVNTLFRIKVWETLISKTYNAARIKK